MKNPFFAILVFAGVFICGGVVGGAVSIHYYEHFVRNRGADRFFERELKELRGRLELTAQQQEETHAIFLRSMADLRTARKQNDVIMERMIADLQAVLTPEQQAKFKEYRAQLRATREQQMRERRAGQSGATEGRTPPPFFMERRERERSPNSSGRPDAPKRSPDAEPPPSPSGAGRDL